MIAALFVETDGVYCPLPFRNLLLSIASTVSLKKESESV